MPENKKIGKDFLENNFGFFFILLGWTRSNAFRFGPDLIRPMNSGDALHCSLCRTVEIGKCSRKKRRRRRRGRADYLARWWCLAGGPNDGDWRWTKGATWPMDDDSSYFSSVSRGIVEVLRSLIFLQQIFFSLQKYVICG